MSILELIKAASIILMPLFVTNICYQPKEFDIKKLNFRDIQLKPLIIRNIISIAVSVLAWNISLYKFPEWTKYERLLLEFLIATLVQFILDVINSEEREKSILFFTFLSSFGIVSYSVLTTGQATITTDTATATLLARAQVQYRELFPHSWCYNNGDLWVLNPNLFVIPFTFFIHNQSLARMLTSLLIILITSFFIYIVSKKYFKNDSWLISIPLFTLSLFGEYYYNIYQVAYTLLMAWILLAVWMFYEAVTEEKKQFIIAFSFFIILLMLHGIRYTAEIVLPLLLAFYTVTYFDDNSHYPISIKKVFWIYTKPFFILVVPSIIGYGLYKTICIDHIMNYSNNNVLIFSDSLNTCWNNLITVIISCFQNFGYEGSIEPGSINGLRNLFSIGITLLLVFIIPLLQFKNISKETKQVKLFFTFGLFHNLEMISIRVLFTLDNKDRYLLSSIFVWIIISSVYIYNHRTEFKSSIYIITTVVMIAMTVIHGGAIIEDSTDWDKKLYFIKYLYDEIASHGLNKGYASYWEAGKGDLYSDLELCMAPIIINEKHNYITAQWGLIDKNRFIEKNIDNNNSFVILNADENSKLKNSLFNVCGDPVEEFEIINDNDISEKAKFYVLDISSAYYVYVWDYDINEKFINGLIDNVLELKEISENEYIEKRESIAYIKKNGKIESKYNYLESGTYAIEFDGKNLKNAIIEITAEDEKDRNKFSYTETCRNSERIVVNLISKKRVNKLWLKIINSFENEIGFEKMTVQRIG